jgi:DNA-directed RNA polymerase specialized sigma24 family protein
MAATAPHHSDALDAQLVLRAQDGDRDAFTELFHRHAGPAWRLALAVSGSTDVAATAVTKGFTLTLVRLQRRTTTLAVPFRHLVTRASGEAAASASRQDDSDTKDAPNDVADAFYSLPERWRAALWLTVAEGGTPAQIAPIIGLSEEGTASLVDRAGDGLRARLARSTPLGSHSLRVLSDARPQLRAIAVPLPLALEAAAVRQWEAWQQTVAKDKRHGLAAVIPLRPWVERAVSTAAALVFAAGIAAAINQSARSAGHDAPMLASPTHRIESAASVQHRTTLPITLGSWAGHSVGTATPHGSSTHGTAPATSSDSARASTPSAPSAPASTPTDPPTTTTQPAPDPPADQAGATSPSAGGGTTVASTPVAVTAGADGVGVTVGSTTVGNTTPTTAPDSGISVSVDPGNGIAPIGVTVPF